jgi:molybdopterin synthase sulfur carrier subunit
MATVTLRYWAAAREAAGVTEEKVEARTLAEALAAGRAAVRDRQAGPGSDPSSGAGQAERFGLILARSSFLINSDPAGTRLPESITLPDDAVVEVLPPFAGG